MSFMNFYTECQTSMFVLFAFMNTFDISVETRARDTNVYTYVYLGSMILSLILLMVNIGYRVIVWGMKKMRKRRQVAEKKFTDVSEIKDDTTTISRSATETMFARNTN